MNPEIQKEIDKQLESLPEKVREVIKNVDVEGEVLKLKEEHHLMLDQVSDLELEILLTMIGLEAAENFVDNLMEILKMNETKAIALANDVDVLVFSKIRSAMMELTEKDDGDEALNRETILNEIENPTPSFSKENTAPINTNPTNIPEIAPTQTLQKYTPPIQTKNIVDQKLSEPTHIQPEKIDVSLKKLPQVNQTTDPYRESF